MLRKDLLKDIIATSDGGFLLAGTSNSPISGDKSTERRGNDFWVVKISSTGVKEWDRSYGGDRDDIFAKAVANPDGSFLLGNLQLCL